MFSDLFIWKHRYFHFEGMRRFADPAGADMLCERSAKQTEHEENLAIQHLSGEIMMVNNGHHPKTRPNSSD